MRNLIKIAESLNTATAPTMTLWHGGRNLETDYLEIRSHGKGRWEHGPGLYLTSHFDTASKYAKGGGKLYRVTVRQGTNIDDVTVSREEAVAFIDRHVVKRLRAQMISDIDRNLARRSADRIQAEVMINLCLNHEAIPNTKTGALRQFLIDQGADYMTTRYGGRDETVMVVFNPRIIEKVEVVKIGDVSPEEYVLSPVFGNSGAL